MRQPEGFFPRAISFVRLPDGRWAIQNERNVADLTRDDLVAMSNAFFQWCELHDMKLKARAWE